jgi:energy-coupling factor transporter ATP-binding protein EcfA2
MTKPIEVEHVFFSYLGFSMEDVSTELKAGELKAVVGLNGSGKTTLFRLILGLLEPRQGEVRVFGRTVTRKNLWAIRQDFGFLFQSPQDQLFAPTVWEDVAFGPRNQGLPEEEVSARVQQALDIVSLSEMGERSVNRLSHGEGKRVALAGIIAMRPKILLLDEPFTGLDFPMIVGLLDIVNSLRKEEGVSVMYTTHDRFFLENWADSILALRRGRVLYDGIVDVALARDDLRPEIGGWNLLKEHLVASLE